MSEYVKAAESREMMYQTTIIGLQSKVTDQEAKITYQETMLTQQRIKISRSHDENRELRKEIDALKTKLKKQPPVCVFKNCYHHTEHKGNRKIANKDHIKIFNAYKWAGLSRAAIARAFGVSGARIAQIVSRQERIFNRKEFNGEL